MFTFCCQPYLGEMLYTRLKPPPTRHVLQYYNPKSYNAGLQTSTPVLSQNVEDLSKITSDDEISSWTCLWNNTLHSKWHEGYHAEKKSLLMWLICIYIEMHTYIIYTSMESLSRVTILQVRSKEPWTQPFENRWQNMWPPTRRKTQRMNVMSGV